MKSGIERIGYFLITFLVSLIALGLENMGNGITTSYFSRFFGVYAVYRLTMALFIFYSLLAIFVSCSDEETSKELQKGFFKMKILIILVLIIIFAFIPNGFFDGFSKFAIFSSVFFLLLSIIYFIDFGYSWNENWVSRGEDKYLVAVVVCAVIMYVGGIIGIVYLWNKYSCSLNIVQFIVVIILAAISLFLTLVAEHGAILPAAVVFIYHVSLLYGAMANYTDATCNPNFGKSEFASEIVSALWALLALSYTSVSVSSSSSKDINLGGEEEDEEVTYNYLVFNLTMALAACYIPMLFTDWTQKNSATLSISAGSVSYWVKIVMGIITALGFLWTIIGPVLFPNMDFDYV
ncbi:hypothetical protein PCE1_003869 [Barthelona sp. PCE]